MGHPWRGPPMPSPPTRAVSMIDGSGAACSVSRSSSSMGSLPSSGLSPGSAIAHGGYSFGCPRGLAPCCSHPSSPAFAYRLPLLSPTACSSRFFRSPISLSGICCCICWSLIEIPFYAAATRILACISIFCGVADGILILLDWSGPHVAVLQIVDALLTIPTMLIEAYPLVLIGFAIGKTAGHRSLAGGYPGGANPVDAGVPEFHRARPTIHPLDHLSENQPRRCLPFSAVPSI